jgi:hypothetical protein
MDVKTFADLFVVIAVRDQVVKVFFARINKQLLFSAVIRVLARKQFSSKPHIFLPISLSRRRHVNYNKCGVIKRRMKKAGCGGKNQAQVWGLPYWQPYFQSENK